jgi:sterol desaturase/sphingolipid hydroxylase (fatty acid hydroxylase superfamily)
MTVEEFFERGARHLFEPFTSVAAFVDAASGARRALTDLESNTAWPFLISSLLIAWAIWWIGRRRGVADGTPLREFLLPRAVYRHPSAVVDYRYLVVDLTIRGLVYTPLFAGVGYLVYRVLRSHVSGIIGNLSVGGAVSGGVVMTLSAVLLTDFTAFVGHYLMHRIPIFWYFHQVHHSAEVLTPATLYRMHPVDTLLMGVVSAMTGALYSALSGQEVRPLAFFGINVVVVAFSLAAFQLRHSHIWLSYGPVIGRIFISPAQHQIHHSTDPKHWNKNYGFMLAVWDVLFRSLYVPRSREQLHFGLADSDAKDFASVRALYFRPFVKVFQHLRRSQREETGAAAI